MKSKIALVHGFINKELKTTLAHMGMPYHREIWNEGGYLHCLASSDPFYNDIPKVLVNMIYEAEDYLPDVRKSDEDPAFTGILPKPYPIAHGFEFVGGFRGFEENLIEPYRG